MKSACFCPGMAKTGRLGQTAYFCPGMAKTGRIDQDGPSWPVRAVLDREPVFALVWPRWGRLGQTTCFCPGMVQDGLFLPWYGQDGLSWTETFFNIRSIFVFQLTLYYITAMDVEMPHQDDVVQQGPPMDPETLALSQHEWLQFDPASAAAMRCRRIIRMSMGMPRCIDWGVLGDCREAERARAILGEDTPWTRLFDLAKLPTYRLLTVEFLSTFRYRAHQAAVRVEEDAELPPDIEFSLGGQHFEMSIERFAVHLGIYYEPETVSDKFTQGLTQGEEGVIRAWWAQISDTPFTGHRVRAMMIRDPLIRYIHRCIVTTISGSGLSQEWVTTTDLFYLHSLIAGRPCNLARCFALYYASFYHRQERGTL
ncbi:hypothetical protein R6Q57_013214 [Mikania cordata]